MNLHEDPLYVVVQSAIFSMALTAMVVAASVCVAGFFNPLNDSALPAIAMIIVFFVGLWYLPQRRKHASPHERARGKENT